MPLTHSQTCQLRFTSSSSGHVFGWCKIRAVGQLSCFWLQVTEPPHPLIGYTMEFIFSYSCYGNKYLPSDGSKMLISVFPSYEGCCGTGHHMDFKVERKRKAVEGVPTCFHSCQLAQIGVISSFVLQCCAVKQFFRVRWQSRRVELGHWGRVGRSENSTAPQA